MTSISHFLQNRLPAKFHIRLRDYWLESKRPLTSLLFVLPLLAAYEMGVLIVPTTMRNGADAWMRRLLDSLGFGGYFLLPCLTLVALLAWHHVLRQPWRVNRWALAGMLCESMALALALIGLAHLQGLVSSISVPSSEWPGSTNWSPQDAPLGAAVAAATSDPRHLGGAAGAVGRIIAFCGAGLYEEVLFRLLLVPVAARAAAMAGLRRRWCIAVAVVSTSLLFSLAHYVGTGGDAWAVSSFLFRCLAGVFFALLFVGRGFGIAAGTHAIYDVLVGVG